MRLIKALTLLAAVAIPASALADTIDVSTGTAGWTYSTGGSTPSAAVTVTTINSAWTAQNNTTAFPTAKWISTTDNSATGTATQNVSFLFTSGEFQTNGSLSGSFASDNYASLQLFDVTTGQFVNPQMFGNGTDATSYSTFQTATGFDWENLSTSDMYQLEADVYNGAGTSGNPVGLLVQANSPTPEPSGLLLLGTGALATATAARRRFLKR